MEGGQVSNGGQVRASFSGRLLPSSISRIESYGDAAARRFGEGMRPNRSQVLQAMVRVVFRHPEIEQEIMADLVRVRIKDKR